VFCPLDKVNQLTISSRWSKIILVYKALERYMIRVLVAKTTQSHGRAQQQVQMAGVHLQGGKTKDKGFKDKVCKNN
jgi:hypothetical protein